MKIEVITKLDDGEKKYVTTTKERLRRIMEAGGVKSLLNDLSMGSQILFRKAKNG